MVDDGEMTEQSIFAWYENAFLKRLTVVDYAPNPIRIDHELVPERLKDQPFQAFVAGYSSVMALGPSPFQ